MKRWQDMYTFERESAVRKCGWITCKDTISRTGKKIMTSEWDNLSTAAQNVLYKHGYNK